MTKGERAVRSIFLLFFALFVSACGGGGTNDDGQLPSMLVVFRGGTFESSAGQSVIVPITLTCNRDDGCLITGFGVISRMTLTNAVMRRVVMGVWQNIPSSNPVMSEAMLHLDLDAPLLIPKGEAFIEIEVRIGTQQADGVFPISSVLDLALGSVDYRGPLPSVRIGGGQ